MSALSRAQSTTLAVQGSQSSCPGDTAEAMRHGLRQGRPASDEEKLGPSIPGFPGGSKADLPVTCQLRGGFHPSWEAMGSLGGAGLGGEMVHSARCFAQKPHGLPTVGLSAWRMRH